MKSTNAQPAAKPDIRKITIMNKNCQINSSNDTLCGTIYGYKGSTAETYANSKNLTFVALDGEPESTLGTAKAPRVDSNGVVQLALFCRSAHCLSALNGST